MEKKRALRRQAAALQFEGALFRDDAAERVDVGGGQRGAVFAEGRPGVPGGADQAAGDAIAGGGQQPGDTVEGAREGLFGGGGGRGFLLLGGGVFGGADSGGAEGEDLVGEAGVDGAGGEGVDVEGLVARFVGDGFDEADDGGFGDAVGGEIDAGLGGATAGEADDFLARRGGGRGREKRSEGADREVGAVEIGADGVAPAGGIGGEGGGDFALNAGGADQGVEVGPGGGDGGGRGGDRGVVGDVATGVVKIRMLGGEGRLVAAGEAPDAVTLREQARGEGAANAGAGAGENDVHALGKRDFAPLVKDHATVEIGEAVGGAEVGFAPGAERGAEGEEFFVVGKAAGRRLLGEKHEITLFEAGDDFGLGGGGDTGGEGHAEREPLVVAFVGDDAKNLGVEGIGDVVHRDTGLGELRGAAAAENCVGEGVDDPELGAV